MEATRLGNNFTNKELINLLQEDCQALSIVYKRHKDNCINFMKSIYNDNDEIKDIFQDSCSPS